MDDYQSIAVASDACYQCPGEFRTIDRGTHLGRLATYFPACRHCEHRVDVDQLTTPQSRQWAKILARRDSHWRFTSEGLEADSLNDLATAEVGRLAASLGAVVTRDGNGRSTCPTVLVGGGGHWATAPLVAAACGALRLAGCRTADAGALATAPLAAKAEKLKADAALWIGNASGRPHTVALRVWGAAGRPWSTPGGLDLLREHFEAGVARPARRGGTLERIDAVTDYHATLHSFYHALRPLRFVVDTTCRPLLTSLDRLLNQAACERLQLEPTVPANEIIPARSDATFPEKRLATIGRQAVAREAHFGVWIDGAGESCRLVDQTGSLVSEDRLTRLLATYLRRQKSDAAVDPMLTVDSDLTREATARLIESAGAVCAAGAGGRYWFAENAPAPDALLALSLLLAIFSESDRPVSAVLDSA